MPMYKNDRSPRSSRQAYPEVGNKILSTLLLALCILIVAVIFLLETLRSVYVSTLVRFLLTHCALGTETSMACGLGPVLLAHGQGVDGGTDAALSSLRMPS